MPTKSFKTMPNQQDEARRIGVDDVASSLHPGLTASRRELLPTSATYARSPLIPTDFYRNSLRYQ